MIGRRRRRSEAATGGPAGRTRIRAIASRRRIVPSARGPKRIRRRSAIATSQASRRKNRGRSRQAIDPGKTSRARPSGRLANENRGVTSPLRPTIDHGRRNRPARARSESPGWGSRPATRHAVIGPGTAGRRRERSGPGVGSRQGLRANASPGRTSRPVVRREAIGHGRTNRPVVLRAAIARGASRQDLRVNASRGRTSRQARPSGPGVASRAATSLAVSAVHREAIGRGATSRAIRIASRSRHAAPVRAETPRHASGVTTRTDATRRY